MALSYRCSQCGRVSKATEEWYGKVVNCEGCGKAMRIPNPRAAAPASASPPEKASVSREWAAGETPLAPRSSRTVPPAAPARAKKSKKADASEKPSVLKTILSGVVGLFVVLGVVGRYVIKPYRAYQKSQAQNQAPAKAVPSGLPTPVAPRVAPVAAGPWKMPVLPETGEGFELEPGVWLHEIALPGSGGPGAKMPGHSGKLWLYLPDGDHAPKSLPCILIAGAGSILITGMSLGDGDRAEHLPYVRAGFAVLAYELDGMLPEPRPTDDAAFASYIRSFVDAEAGLINMRVAVEYATTRVPSIDPGRLFAVGHSSAATLALLVAENEPRIAACVAFAPVVDLKDHIPTQGQQSVEQLVPGAAQLFTRFNPRNGEEKLNCPLLVFVALDDKNAQPDRDLVDRLKGLGRTAVLATVPNGGHYEPMIKTGIPLAIRWLKGVHRQPDGAVVAPKSLGPAPKVKIQRGPRGGNAAPPPSIRRPRGATPKPD